MNARTLLDNFDLLAEAPGGVPKLRELILQLAVRGKLVPQEKMIHHEERPASLGKLRRASEEHEGKDGGEQIERPYAIPKGWRWKTLRSVTSDLGQKVPDARFTYVDVSAIDKDHGCIGDSVQVLRPEDAPSRARKIVKRGTVIYSTVRPYLLNIAVVDRQFEPAPIVSTAFFVMHPHREVDGRFLFYYLRSKPFTEYVNGVMAGMAYPAVNDAKMTTGPFPLPPLAEQKRIVARVDELMKRCDELEARQNERNERHKVTVAACLHQLVARRSLGEGGASSPPTFRIRPPPTAHRPPITDYWSLITDHFPLLFSSPSSVAELRNTILQLAVQGRLVPQDPRDEPASELLKQIVEEKKRAVKEGRIRKQEPLPSISNEEQPFELPVGWDWIRLGSLGYTQTGTTPSKSNPHYFGEGYPFVKPGDITEKGVAYGKEELTAEGIQVGRLIPAGSAIMVCIGGSIGKIGYVDRDCSCNQQINAITPLCGVDGRFIACWMKSPYVYNQVLSQAPQTTLPILSKGKWDVLFFPLPPLTEQKRIVAKVNELMALCDALEAKLTQSRADADTLAAAVVHHLCASGRQAIDHH